MHQSRPFRAHLARRVLVNFVVVLSAIVVGATLRGVPSTAPTADWMAEALAQVALTRDTACGTPGTARGGVGTERMCIAGHNRTTRGFLSRCFLEPKAYEPRPEFWVGECKGSVNEQTEAIAQTRYIIKRGPLTISTTENGIPVAPPVSGDLQWEVRIPPFADSEGGRVDYLEYKHSTDPVIPGLSPVDFVEFKIGVPGGA